MNTEIGILIVDDDDVHLSILKEKLKNISFLNFREALGYKQAEAELDKQLPDLLLTDFYLDRGRTGLDLIKDKLLNSDVPIIILSTFYNESVFDEILKIRPIDFLSKSCSEFELKKAIELAVSKYQSRSKDPAIKDYFFVRIGKLMQKIAMEDVEMIEVEGKYLNVFTSQKSYVLRSGLNDFERRLPEHFIKVHQSYLVNMKFVESVDVENQIIRLKSCQAPFSRNFRKTFLSSYYLL